MIQFVKLSETALTISYEFLELGFKGIVTIDKANNTAAIFHRPKYGKIEYADKDVERLCYIAQKELPTHNFPDKYTYAWC